MKILLINSFDTKGGAAKAAKRLHEALNYIGCKSLMLVQHKETDDPNILTETNKLKIFLNLFLSKLESFFVKMLLKDVNNYSLGLFSSIGIVKRINEMKPDIVHLHWTQNSMLSLKDISKIKAPVIWTLHDNWAFSGGCHNLSFCKNHLEVSHKCNKYINITFLRKKWAYLKNRDINFVSLSSWLFNLANNSELLSGKYNHNLPNPINTKTFSPIDQNHARNTFNLPLDKKLILFGALNAVSDQNKGLHLLRDSLENLTHENYELVVFGNVSNVSDLNFRIKTHYFKKFEDDQSINLILNTSDVLVVPSIQENFSNIILEGLAASVPVIAFNVGGNIDLIDHMKNGYLAEPFDTKELLEGIEWILEHDEPKYLKENARNKAIREFDQKVVAAKYLDLYNEVAFMNHKTI